VAGRGKENLIAGKSFRSRWIAAVDEMFADLPAWRRWGIPVHYRWLKDEPSDDEPGTAGTSAARDLDGHWVVLRWPGRPSGLSRLTIGCQGFASTVEVLVFWLRGWGPRNRFEGQRATGGRAHASGEQCLGIDAQGCVSSASMMGAGKPTRMQSTPSSTLPVRLSGIP